LGKVDAMRKLKLALTLALALLALPCWAQTPVIATPIPGYTGAGAASSTITVTNTFQQVFAATPVQIIQGPTGSNAPRRAGVIQNTGSNNMWVWFGGNASSCAGATKATSIMLGPNASGIGNPGQSVSFNNGDAVAADLVCITGTATDTFYANQQ
jgi:hypothetical protein